MNPLLDKALCRCCHSEGEFKSLDSVFEFGKKEDSFAVLLQNTLNITINPTFHSSYSICDNCAFKLGHAKIFREQVLKCEKAFQVIINRNCGESSDEEKRLKKELILDGEETLNNIAPVDDINFIDVKSEVERNESPNSDNDVNDNDWKRDGSDDENLLEIKDKEKLYICEYCPKQFKYKGSLETHTKNHTTTKTYECSICHTSCITNKLLIKHIEIDHVVDSKYPCNECMLVFDSSKDLKTHLTKHNKVFKCSICTKEFKRKGGLNDHMLVHTKEKKYTCDICKKSFSHKQTLKDHILIHTGVRPHICDICGRSFHQRTHLQRHLSMVHKKVKHKCNLCNKQFTSKSYLNIHERSHTGAKPFSCDVCKKPFSAYTTLKVHLRVHTGFKPYKCGICDRKFAQLTSYKIHERTHSGERPYSCNVCQKSFSDNGYLKIHLRIHNNVKPYTCNICHRQFRENGQLKRHMYTHNGVKQYTCKVCNKQITHLSKHMKIHNLKSCCSTNHGEFESCKFNCKVPTDLSTDNREARK